MHEYLELAKSKETSIFIIFYFLLPRVGCERCRPLRRHRRTSFALGFSLFFCLFDISTRIPPVFFPISVNVIIFGLTCIGFSNDSLDQYFSKISNPPNSSIKIVDLFAHPLRLSIFPYGFITNAVFEYVIFLLIIDCIKVVFFSIFFLIAMKSHTYRFRSFCFFCPSHLITISFDGVRRRVIVSLACFAFVRFRWNIKQFFEGKVFRHLFRII